MKKLYLEPELELVNIRLLADILGPSTDEPEDESVVTGGGSGWDDGEFGEDDEV